VGVLEVITNIAVLAIIFFRLRALILWYYEIDERITQQYDTNRRLGKLAGELEINSPHLNNARTILIP